jgi:hypothetical protein
LVRRLTGAERCVPQPEPDRAVVPTARARDVLTRPRRRRPVASESPEPLVSTVVYFSFANPSPSFRLRLRFIVLFSGAARSVNRAVLHRPPVLAGESASALDALTEDKPVVDVVD